MGHKCPLSGRVTDGDDPPYRHRPTGNRKCIGTGPLEPVPIARDGAMVSYCPGLFTEKLT